MVGTELAANAVLSWQLELNQQANCRSSTATPRTPEATQTTQLGRWHGRRARRGWRSPTSRSAAKPARDRASYAAAAPVTYAPVAVSALDAELSDQPRSPVTSSTPVKLTPRLVAKALTQSYRLDLPEYPVNPLIGPAPAWAAQSDQMTHDPEFRALNPELPAKRLGHAGAAAHRGPFCPTNSCGNGCSPIRPAAAWLNGTPDESGMVVNPAYQPHWGLLRSTRSPGPTRPVSTPDKAAQPRRSAAVSICFPTSPTTTTRRSYPGSATTRRAPFWDLRKHGPGRADRVVGHRRDWSPRAIFLWGVIEQRQHQRPSAWSRRSCATPGSSCVGPDRAR